MSSGGIGRYAPTTTGYMLSSLRDEFIKPHYPHGLGNNVDNSDLATRCSEACLSHVASGEA
jgi:hypothetical protein